MRPQPFEVFHNRADPVVVRVPRLGSILRHLIRLGRQVLADAGAVIFQHCTAAAQDHFTAVRRPNPAWRDIGSHLRRPRSVFESELQLPRPREPLRPRLCLGAPGRVLVVAKCQGARIPSGHTPGRSPRSLARSIEPTPDWHAYSASRWLFATGSPPTTWPGQRGDACAPGLR